MEIIHSAFSVFWFVIAILLTGFILWRKLRHERVDSDENVFDIVVLSGLGSVVIGRLAFILFHLPAFGTDIGKWIAVTEYPGNIGVFSLLSWLLLFWKLMKSDWKDTIELVDYAAIALTFFLFFLGIGDVLSQIISLVQSTFIVTGTVQPLLNIQTLVVSIIFTIFYGVLYIFLSRVEKNYRTLLWYRAKRRSAQTGFVVACFLIGYGLSGFILSWFVPMNMNILGVGIDPIVKLLVMFTGFVILYVRSGRSFFQKA